MSCTHCLFNTEHSVFESKVVEIFCHSFNILFFEMMDFLLVIGTEVFMEQMVRYIEFASKQSCGGSGEKWVDKSWGMLVIEEE